MVVSFSFFFPRVLLGVFVFAIFFRTNDPGLGGSFLGVIRPGVALGLSSSGDFFFSNIFILSLIDDMIRKVIRYGTSGPTLLREKLKRFERFSFPRRGDGNEI